MQQEDQVHQSTCSSQFVTPRAVVWPLGSFEALQILELDELERVESGRRQVYPGRQRECAG